MKKQSHRIFPYQHQRNVLGRYTESEAWDMAEDVVFRQQMREWEDVEEIPTPADSIVI